MSQPTNSMSGSKARFRISLLLLTGLLLTKLWTLGGHANIPAPDQNAPQMEGTTGEFSSVAKENAQVWGLAGSILNLFSGGGRSASQVQPEADDDEAYRRSADDERNRRYQKEYDERRTEERDQKEQEMYDAQDRRRAEEQQYHDQQQQPYYDQRKQEQGY